MSNNVPTIYRELLNAQRQSAEACFERAEDLAIFSFCHNFLSELSTLREVLTGRPEQACFDVAITEYQYGLSALITSQYRHAFGGLRLSLELALATVYFSAHEVKLRQWLAGTRDISWGGLTDENKGVFSKPFTAAFNPSLSELRRSFAGLAATVYRECSEYVHGNPSTHDSLAGEIRYRPELLSSWKEKLESVRLCVLYLHFLRFASSFDEASLNKLEPIMMDAFGHEQRVRQYFERPAE